LGVVALLERLFPGSAAELWLQGRCINPVGEFSRFDWSTPGPGRLRVELGSSGYLLMQAPSGAERHVERCCAYARAPLELLCSHEARGLELQVLQSRAQRLETESAWLYRCFALLRAAGEVLDPESVLEQITPLILQGFPGDLLMLGLPAQPCGWERRRLDQGPAYEWPPTGGWVELWETATRYNQVLHFEDLEKSRFKDSLPEMRSITVAPLGFGMGILCRSSQEPKELSRDFELGATLLGYLLKLAQLHQQVLDAFQQLQQSELQLVRTGKLAAVGQIAAGVAHEMNNPLAAIQISLEMAARDKALSPGSARALQTALEALERCRSVARELLTFSRQSQHEQREFFVVQDVARRAMALSAEWAASRGIKLHSEPGGESLWSEGNPAQVQEILLHLIDNALWAAESGGKTVTISSIGTSGWVELHVRDTGAGVPEENQSKIFEPFWTTRPMGEATGLGLAVARGNAEKLGGSLTLEESGPAGSRFVLRLKRTAKA
jgi:signal transduction histidine kinase